MGSLNMEKDYTMEECLLAHDLLFNGEALDCPDDEQLALHPCDHFLLIFDSISTENEEMDYVASVKSNILECYFAGKAYKPVDAVIEAIREIRKGVKRLQMGPSQ